MKEEARPPTTTTYREDHLRWVYLPRSHGQGQNQHSAQVGGTLTPAVFTPLCSAPLSSGSWHSNWDTTVDQPSWAPGPLFTGLSQPFLVLWRPLCSQVPDDCSPRAGLRANQISPGPPSPPRTCCPSTWQLRQKAASEIYLMKDTVFFVEQTMKS